MATPDVYLTGQDDGFEAAEDTVKQVVGTIKMPTEAALMSLITDWRRFVRASVKWRRMNSPTVDAAGVGDSGWGADLGAPERRAEQRGQHHDHRDSHPR